MSGFADGQFGGGSNGAVARAYQSADAAYTTDATLNNTELTFNVGSAGKYVFRAVLHLTVGDGGIKVAFGGTATVSNFIAQYAGIEATSFAGTMARITTATTIYTIDAAGNYILTIDGGAEFSAGGTFVLQVSQNASDPSATTLLRGSSLTLTKI